LSRRLPYLLNLPIFLIYSAIVIVPVAWAVFLSFNKVTLNLHPSFTGLDNYLQLLRDPLFSNALRASAIFVGGSVAGQFLLGFIMALLVNEGGRGTDFFRTTFMITMAMSDAVVGYAWYILMNDNGILNQFMSSLSLSPIMWLSQPNIAILSIVIANVWFGGSFAMIILETGLKSIPRDVYESAAVDGASQAQRFRWMTLPLVKPFIATCLTTITILTFNYFGLILVLTGGGPIHATEVVPLFMWNLAFEFGDFGYGAAVGVFAIMINIVAIVAYRSLLRR
jgi:multiple sugar transport system permease protein